MGKLPSMPRKDRIYKTEQLAFAGLRHFENCTDGEIYDMENMVCDEYPGLRTRKERAGIASVGEGVRQIYADNGAILSVRDNCLYYNDLLMVHDILDWGTFVRFGNRVVMMPDKILLNLNYKILGFGDPENMPESPEEGDCYAVLDQWGEYKLMIWHEGQWTDGGYFAEDMEFTTMFAIPAYFENGRIYNKEAKANTLRFVGLPLSENTGPGRLKEGDGVQIEGCTVKSQNNKIAIIREIDEDGDGNMVLRFSEYCFAMPEGEDGTMVDSFREEGIVVKRTMPDMEILFEHGNRLWGAKGKEIFASKVGDPRNWNCIDGLASDSWYLATQGKGEFTAGVSYGYPRFFKEGSMVTVYGSVPSGYQTTEQQILGVKRGEQRSLVQCNGLLFWNSPKGMVIYNGSTVALQEQALGDFELESMIGCGEERYVYFGGYIGRNPVINHVKIAGILRFDTERQLWSREACNMELRCMSFDQGVLYGLYRTGDIVVLNGGETEREKQWEGAFESFVEFGDFTEGTGSRKGVSRLRLRLSVEKDSYVGVLIRYGSAEEWKSLRRIEHQGKETITIPIVPRRCDHYRIRLEGYGQWKLYSMERERYFGTDMF